MLGFHPDDPRGKLPLVWQHRSSFRFGSERRLATVLTEQYEISAAPMGRAALYPMGE